MTYTELHTYRQMIVKGSASLSDEDALNVPMLYDEWAVGHTYAVGDRVYYEENLYRCEQAHTAQEDWSPSETKALWTNIAEPGTIPVWVQPTGAQDAYNTGDKVHYPTADDPVYVSTVDANVWAPGVYGWDLYEEEAIVNE